MAGPPPGHWHFGLATFGWPYRTKALNFAEHGSDTMLAGERMRFVVAAVVALQTALLALVWLIMPPELMPDIVILVIAAASFVALWVLLTSQESYRFRRTLTFLGVIPIELMALSAGGLVLFISGTWFVEDMWHAGPRINVWIFVIPSLFMTLSAFVVLGWSGRRAFTPADNLSLAAAPDRMPLSRRFVPGHFAPLVVLLVVVSLLAVAAAHPLKRYLDGYCYAQDRFVPDDEFIANALAYRAKFVKGLPADPTREDLRTYVRQHPNCCTVMGPDFFLASSFRARLFGYSRTWVRIVHPLPDEERAELDDPVAFSDVYIKLDRCGKPLSNTGQHHAAR